MNLSLIGIGVLAFGPLLYMKTIEAALKKGLSKLGVGLSLLALTLGALFVFVEYTGPGQELDFWLNFRYDLLRENPDFTLANFQTLFGYHGFFAIAFVPFILIYALINKAAQQALFPLTFGVFLTIFWINTLDVNYVPPPFLALFTSLGLYWIWTLIFNRTKKVVKKYKSGKRKTTEVKQTAPKWAYVIPIAMAAFLIYPQWPAKKAYRHYMDEGHTNGLIIYPPEVHMAMDWLKENSPVPTWPVDQINKGIVNGGGDKGYLYPEGAYGVMTIWDYGNIVNQRAERIPVWSRWPSAVTASWVTATTEASSLEKICPGCEEGEEVRYAMVDASTVSKFFLGKVLQAGGTLDDYQGRVTKKNAQTGVNTEVITYGSNYENSIAVQLFKKDGDGLDHYRLVYDSPTYSMITFCQNAGQIKVLELPINTQQEMNSYSAMLGPDVYSTSLGPCYESYISPRVKIFEVVQGVRITGKAAPSTLVSLKLNLKSTNSNRTFVYSNHASADGDGNFEIIAPYPTGEQLTGTAIGSVGDYELTYRSSEDPSVQDTQNFSVTEDQVKNGTVMDIIR